MADETQHSYTKGGNIRAPTKTQICNMVVSAWNSIPEEMVLKSFKVCGQAPDIEVSDILAFRDKKTCADGRPKLESLWDINLDRIDFELLELKELEATPDVDINVLDYDENNTYDYDYLSDPENPLI